MNIKSLLLGSAAALAAVSGARAADAVVVAEPEPMEYVRICDVYGAGYYYIPGTETCLKIGGYVRYEIQYRDDDDGWKKLARAELTFTAKSETEYGTLTGHIDLRGDVNSGASNNYTIVLGDTDNDGIPDEVSLARAARAAGVNVQHAWLSLGGLQMGFSDTLYDGDIGGEFDSGGGNRVHFVRYNWDGGNGITASVSIEEDTFNDNYVPNVVGKVGIAQGWGSLSLFAGYDSEDDRSTITFSFPPLDASINAPGDDEWALKAIASIKASEALTLEAMATYESGPSTFSVGTPLQSDPPGYEWSLAGYAKFAATPKLSIGAGGQYFADQHGNGNDDWTIGAVVDYTIVENFTSKLAVNYTDGDSVDDGVFSGFLRFDRSF